MADRFRGITIEIDGNTTKLETALKRVDRETRSLDRELRKVDKALKFNPTSVSLWEEKQKLLTKQVDETGSKLEKLKQAQDKMDADGVDKNSEEYRNLQREIALTEAEQKKFEKELRKIGNVKLHALGEQFKQVGQKMTEAGKNLSMKVTAPLVAVGAVGAQKFAEVDKVMQLTNSTMGNTSEQADLLNNAMKSAAASSTYGMNDAAQATLNFARAGLDAGQAAAALAPAMALAAGEGGDLDTVSAGLVATINGFHGSFEDASNYADVFANACNNSALDVNSLADAMSVAAPIFSSAGYEVKDAALYMGVMANSGIEANKAANSLKTGLARLVSPSKEGAAMLDKLNISVTNADGTMKDSVEIQADLNKAFSQLSESEQLAAASAIFGKSQMAPWLALINTAPADVEKLNVALDENGTALEMQSAMMSGFGGSLEKLKSGLDVAATSLGEALAPAILAVANGIQKLVDWFNNLSPTAQRVIAVIGVIAAAIGPLLVIVGTLASSIGSIINLVGMVAPMLGGVGTAVGALSSGALLPIIAIIGAVIAIGVLLYKNWDLIKAKATQFAKSVKATWAKFKADTVAQFRAIRDAIVKPIQSAIDKVKAIIAKIKGFFPIRIGKLLSGLELPHFSLDWATKDFGKLGSVKYPTGLNVDWYERGGIFDSPTIAGIGENGAEAVLPLDKFWNKMDRMAENMQGGNTYNFYITGDNPKAIAEEVKRILIKETNNRRLVWQ